MLPDPVELMEMRIDELAHEQFAGVPDGCIRCYGCKQIVFSSTVAALFGHPDAPAYCDECRKKAGVEW